MRFALLLIWPALAFAQCPAPYVLKHHDHLHESDLATASSEASHLATVSSEASHQSSFHHHHHHHHHHHPHHDHTSQDHTSRHTEEHHSQPHTTETKTSMIQTHTKSHDSTQTIVSTKTTLVSVYVPQKTSSSSLIPAPQTTSHVAPPPLATTTAMTTVHDGAPLLKAVSTTSSVVCSWSSIILDTSDIMVAAHIHHEDLMPDGSHLCSEYYGVNENDAVTWSTNQKIADDENAQSYKGYSSVAIPGGDSTGIGSQLSDVSSIPLAWDWDIHNSTEWQGDVIVDMKISPHPDDASSPEAVELMLYFDYTDQLGFIGQSNGVVKTISLFGRDDWSVYYGQGKGNTWMTASLIPSKEGRYKNGFRGDIAPWIEALMPIAHLTNSMYLNAATAGIEAFFGDLVADHITTFKIETR